MPKRMDITVDDSFYKYLVEGCTKNGYPHPATFFKALAAEGIKSGKFEGNPILAKNAGLYKKIGENAAVVKGIIFSIGKAGLTYTDACNEIDDTVEKGFLSEEEGEVQKQIIHDRIKDTVDSELKKKHRIPNRNSKSRKNNFKKRTCGDCQVKRASAKCYYWIDKDFCQKRGGKPPIRR